MLMFKRIAWALQLVLISTGCVHMHSGKTQHQMTVPSHPVSEQKLIPLLRKQKIAPRVYVPAQPMLPLVPRLYIAPEIKHLQPIPEPEVQEGPQETFEREVPESEPTLEQEPAKQPKFELGPDEIVA